MKLINSLPKNIIVSPFSMSVINVFFLNIIKIAKLTLNVIVYKIMDKNKRSPRNALEFNKIEKMFKDC